jgi:N-acetyltransferase
MTVPVQAGGAASLCAAMNSRCRSKLRKLPAGTGRLMRPVPSTGMWRELTCRMEGSIVALEPLGEEHREGLRVAARALEIWRWLPHLQDGLPDFEGWFDASLEAAATAREGVFATLGAKSGEPLGSTRYMNLRPEHRGLEIGFTWLTPSAWGTGANVEAKLLMLEDAFERLDCVRVEFKTDARNDRSRRALEALPARFEGVLRSHMEMPGVGLRDSAYYSVIAAEWEEVRANLRRRLAS